MSDTERLNLVEHYQWMVIVKPGGKWCIIGSYPGLAEGNSFRQAIDNAIALQAKWALGT